MQKMQPDDVLIITADHGCDPCHTGTDHTREYIPVLMYGDSITAGNFGTKDGFCRVGATVLDMLGEISYIDGISLFKDC